MLAGPASMTAHSVLSVSRMFRTRSTRFIASPPRAIRYGGPTVDDGSRSVILLKADQPVRLRNPDRAEGGSPDRDRVVDKGRRPRPDLRRRARAAAAPLQ